MDRRSRGISAYAQQFAIPEDAAASRLAGLVGTRMAEEAIHAAGGLWHEDFPLSLRERSLVAIAAIAAQGGAEARLRGHLQWAMRHGLSADELEAALVMLGVYAGYPRASVAMEHLREELNANREGSQP